MSTFFFDNAAGSRSLSGRHARSLREFDPTMPVSEKYTAVDWNMFLSDSLKYRDTSVVFFGRR